MPEKTDTLFEKEQRLVDFAFNDAVADVFPDMIRRSVPGYETVISLLGVLARHYAQDNSRIYDLGCSLGAATLSIHNQTRKLSLQHICIDNSDAMVKRCRSRLERLMPEASLQVICDKIENINIKNASVVVLNFTLQFLPPEARSGLLETIYRGLLPGAVLILSEKLVFNDATENRLQADWHLGFKRANGYSDLEISQKRASIENILVPDTREQHIQRLQQAGFEKTYQWFQGFNFCSFVAIKQY